MTTIWIASFDIGKKNFAFCVEEIEVEDLLKIQNIPKPLRYYKDGTTKPDFSKVVKDVCKTGKIILLENIDLTDNCENSKTLDPQVFINMNCILDKYKNYWDKCCSFVIEQQMGFGKKRNYMALKLGQHCFSYFLFNYSNFKETVEFPSYNKTQIMGATKKMSKYERKMWAVKTSMDILLDRNDDVSLENIQNRKKRDDVADVIVQLQSYKYLTFVDKN